MSSSNTSRQPLRLYTAPAPIQITAKISDKIPMVVLNLPMAVATRPQPEVDEQGEGQRQRRQVLAGLDGVDGLARDAERGGQRALGEPLALVREPTSARRKLELCAYC
jgi:hypothetical protein